MKVKAKKATAETSQSTPSSGSGESNRDMEPGHNTMYVPVRPDKANSQIYLSFFRVRKLTHARREPEVPRDT